MARYEIYMSRVGVANRHVVDTDSLTEAMKAREYHQASARPRERYMVFENQCGTMIKVVNSGGAVLGTLGGDIKAAVRATHQLSDTLHGLHLAAAMSDGAQVAESKRTMMLCAAGLAEMCNGIRRTFDDPED